MNSRFVLVVVILGGLALTGQGLRRVEAALWAALQAREPAQRIESPGAAGPPALVAGLLGGFRAAVADVAWLRAFERADERDLPGTETTLQLVSAIDPRPLYFWVNGARIMAYDMPGWRIAAAGGNVTVPLAVQTRMVQEQARRALRRLDDAMRYHPASAALWIERANIELNRLGDVAAAAASYRRAWEQPQAPYFTARLHGELLRRMGRKAEALEWLIKLQPRLSPDDPSAGAALVLARIRILETELGVPPEQVRRPESRAAF